MKKIVFCLALCVFCLGKNFAQDETQNVIKVINQVKRASDKYLYAESTNEKWEEAVDNAKTLLSVQIELWAEKSKKRDVTVYMAKANEHLSSSKKS